MKRNLRSLKVGESGIILDFLDKSISLKLLDMGCLPGLLVSVTAKAPLGSPICISLEGFQISLRNEEAESILLQD